MTPQRATSMDGILALGSPEKYFIDQAASLPASAHLCITIQTLWELVMGFCQCPLFLPALNSIGVVHSPPLRRSVTLRF
jgi:hypothetical protein